MNPGRHARQQATPGHAQQPLATDFDVPAPPAPADRAASVPDPRDAPAIRWGVLGPGWIAHHFAVDLLRHTSSTIAAVGSRSLERAQAFASEFDVPHAHGSYGELVADPDVDVVYVATPHAFHRDQAILALRAGKPVLVEKSFTRSVPEALDVFRVAAERGLFAMEAMWTRFLPSTAAVHRLIASGAIGPVVSVSADHGQRLDADPAGRLMNPALAGGALLDLGVYPIAYAHDILGAPSAVEARGTLTQTGVDGQESVVLSYPGRAQATLCATLWAKTPTVAYIAGPDGWIEVPSGFYSGGSPILHPADGTLQPTDTVSDKGYAYEAAEVARCLRAGAQQSAREPWQATLEVLAILDEVRRQVGVRYPGE